MRLRLVFGTSVMLTTLIGVACGLDITGGEIVPAGVVDAGVDAAFDDVVFADDVLNIADSTKDDGDAVVDSPCSGRGGPRMVDVGGYCIDATEVTQAQYLEFVTVLKTGTFDAGALSVCSWKTSYEPPTTGAGVPCYWQPDVTPNVAVVCVDWCDAERSVDGLASDCVDRSTAERWRGTATTRSMRTRTRGTARVHTTAR